jgi:hypothetical protein
MAEQHADGAGCGPERESVRTEQRMRSHSRPRPEEVERPSRYGECNWNGHSTKRPYEEYIQQNGPFKRTKDGPLVLL